MNDVAKWLRNAPYADGLHLAGADEIDRLQAERDAAVKAVNALKRIRDDADETLLNIDAARGEKP